MVMRVLLAKALLRTIAIMRVRWYRVISPARWDCIDVQVTQATLTRGAGKIVLRGCHLGVLQGPFLLSGYIHLEARGPGAVIFIDHGTWINKNATIIANSKGIRIGRGTLIGSRFTAYDSDFHHIEPALRNVQPENDDAVVIGDNVWIGDDVHVLKGVSIGDNCVIGAKSLVTRDVPANCVAAGCPAKVLRMISP